MRNRDDGLHLNCIGLIVNATEYSGTIIRSGELVNDIICETDRIFVPKDCTIVPGVVVVFEVTFFIFFLRCACLIFFEGKYLTFPSKEAYIFLFLTNESSENSFFCLCQIEISDNHQNDFSGNSNISWVCLKI